MSIPKRHHFVPRVHIRKFKTTSGYHLLLKQKNELKNPRSSADFYVKSELNTLGGDDGGKDHTTFENELTLKWDNQFNHYFNAIEENKLSPEKIENNTLLFFFEYAIIAFIRRLKMEPKLNKDFLSFKEVFPDFLDAFDSEIAGLSQYSNEVIEGAKNLFLDFINEIEKLDKKQSQVKFPALIPSEAKMLLPENCHCELFITTQESFILPDCTITALKSRETFEWYGLHANHIVMIGIPLSPILYMELWNSDIITPSINKVNFPTKDKISEINLNLFNASYSQVLLNYPEQIETLHFNFGK